MRRTGWVVWAGVALGGAAGCAPRSPAATSAEVGGDGSAEETLPPTVITPDEALGLPELLARARWRLENREYAAAILDFERALAADVSDDQRHVIQFDYATALDLAGHPERALRIYRDLLGALEGARATKVRVRLVRLYTHFEDYAQAAKLAEPLAPNELLPLERVAVYAARGLGHLKNGDEALAERDLSRGRTVIESEELDRVSAPALDVAALFYGQGELRRVRAEQIDFDPMPEDFAQKLEERAQLVLDAQSAYSHVMRSANAHWSAMAGVRVGQLYQRLHEDLTDMPVPAAVESEEQRTLLRGALRLRYAILVEKAEKMMRHTLMMLDRTGDPSPWKSRAEQALAELERQRERENAAIDALPYSRATLRRALEDLDRRAGGDGSL